MVAGAEWRTDPVLDRYNDISMQLARTHNVEILDTYRIAQPFTDLAQERLRSERDDAIAARERRAPDAGTAGGAGGGVYLRTF